MKLDKMFNILVVEDEAEIRLLISRMLTEAGYNVIEAVDGRDAIRTYDDRANFIDLIVSDLRMPNVTGEEFAKYNFENLHLPFMVCTAVADARTALELSKFGVRDYIVKPIDEKGFLITVQHAIKRSVDLFSGYSEEQFDGNVGSISFPSQKGRIFGALDWIRDKTKEYTGNKEAGKLVNYAFELLINAHEHGNLNISDDEKTELILNGNYDEEIRNREAACNKKITVSVSILSGEVGISICDEGNGFDYEKYLHMPDEKLLARLNRPSGRGILISKKYFDAIEYSKGGTCVSFFKSFFCDVKKPSVN